MIIGIPRERKTQERRVVLDPAGVRVVVSRDHIVLIEEGAGEGAGYPDEAYKAAGARLVPAASDAWAADLVVKVKEPQPPEFEHFRSDLILFCYLHLAAEPELTRALVTKGVDAHAFETVEERGRLPLLAPMSEVAGRAAVVFGASYLANGSGTLLSGAAGVPPANVVVIGMGVAGQAAARSAIGQDAVVAGVDVDLERLFDARARGYLSSTFVSNETYIEESVAAADLVIGAALVPGARAPRLLKGDNLRAMRPGSVFVDLAIDQGGCSETSRPTSLDDPVYYEHGVIHYCVTNVPGQYPRTATRALSAAVAPRLVQLADDRNALVGSSNVSGGVITHPEVSRAFEGSLAPVA